MLSPLAFMLALSGIVLLVIGERMGLPPVIGINAALSVVAFVLVVLGLGSVTSRFERFSRGTFARRFSLFTLSSRVACLLVLVLAFAPNLARPLWVWPAFAAGFLIAHFAQTVDERPEQERSAMARLARLAMAAALLLTVLAVLPGLMTALSRATGFSLQGLALMLAMLGALVFVPGGAAGIGRVQGVCLALALTLSLGPVLILLGLAGADRGDPLMIETLRGFSLTSYTDQGPGFALLATLGPGLVAGFAARGQTPLKRLSAAGGLATGSLFAALLVALYLFGEDWLARIVGGRIVNLPPPQWPAFVFDEEVRGWLRACNVIVADPAAALKACALPAPNRLIPAGELTVMASQSSVALARAAGLPVLLGGLWLLLPGLVGFAGMLSLLHEGALAISEAFLFRTLNPTGLKSWRLAMARLLLLASAALVVCWPLVKGRLPLALEGGTALFLGLAMLGFAWQCLRPAQEPAP